MRDLERLRWWLYRVALAAVVIAGLIFRSTRYFWNPIGLWMDEAWWARRLFEQPLTHQLFRPIGYMAVTRLLASIHANEATLRLLSWVGGVLSVFISVYLAGRLFRSRSARFFFVFAIALNPVLIDMAREFKPYSLEFCAHLGLLALFVGWDRNRRRRWVWALLACLTLLFPLVYNIVFALPGLFGLLAVKLWRARERWSVVVVAVCAVLAVSIQLGVYHFAIKNMDLNAEEEGWARKYNVFYLHGDTRVRGRVDGETQAGWLGSRYLEIARFPGIQRDYWSRPQSWAESTMELLRGLDRKVWVFLHFSGLLWLLYRRRFTELTLFFAPLMVMIAFNLLGYWPLGGFRVNTFVLAYLMFPAMFALDAAPARPRLLRAAAVAFGSALIVLPSLTLGWSDHTRKYALTFNYEIDALMGKLTELYQLTPQRYAKQQAVVIEDNYTCWSTGYYQRYDDGFKNRWPEISKRLELRCSGRRGERFAMKRMRGRTYFVVVTRNPNLNPSELELVDVLVREVVNQTHTVYLVRGK